MANMLIVRPIAPKQFGVYAGAQSDGQAGTGAFNLLSPDPKEVYNDGGFGGFRIIEFLFEGNILVDSFFLGFVGEAPGATVDVRYAPLNAAETSLGLQGVVPTNRTGVTRRHMLVRTPAPVLAGVARFYVSSQQAARMTIGIAAVGLSFQPRRNREWGGGRRPIDTGSAEPLPSGGFGIGEGVVKSSFRWTFGDLDDDELDRLDELAMDRGNRRPVIVVENPDVDARLHQRIHYGLLDRFEFQERRNVALNRWALGVTDWV